MSPAVKAYHPLDFHWPTQDPFLFCAYHHDHYPKGDEDLGPAVAIDDRPLGSDFTIKDGFRMYHGQRVPGFPAHPHRGFETLTIVEQGLVDHADSMGAAGRYGGGDAQWMTAGKGIQHSEMFPLIHQDRDNQLELFQIWINLPAAQKMCEPHFKMLWRQHIPTVQLSDEQGLAIKIKVIAGRFENTRAPQPTPESWANIDDNEVNVWLIHMQAGARWTLPAGSVGLNRSLYFYRGDVLKLPNQDLKAPVGLDLYSDQGFELRTGEQDAYFLLLQGRPIAEPVAHYGPFVMNTHQELQQAFYDYQRTEFGGWPWPNHDTTHGSSQQRFARHADGQEFHPD